MKKKFLIGWLFPLLLLTSTVNLSAQHLEAGLTIGGSNYLGDLTPSRLWISVGDIQLAGGVLLRYHWVDWISFRAGYQYGRIQASDANARNADGRKRRNLSFRSTLHELSIGAEINIFGYRPVVKRNSFAPFLFGGIAVFRFSPQAQLNGQWIDLQPLGTEGQGLPDNPAKYKQVQLSIPVGIGFKYALSKHINLGIEAGIRKTFTDYLDDVSSSYPNLTTLAETNGELAATLSWRSDEINPEAIPPVPGSGRGDPRDLDWYTFSEVFFTYNFIGGTKRNRRGRSSKKLKCPTF